VCRKKFTPSNDGSAVLTFAVRETLKIATVF